MKRSLTFISKKMSYALRHNPEKYGLTLDEYGYTDVAQFLQALNRMHHFTPRLKLADLEKVIAQSDKQRFEIRNGKICALYGHSIPGIIKRRAAVPPAILYHGTARRFLASIKREGLLPMSRQYVHLSTDVATAKQVGLRRDSQPVILTIATEKAQAAGVQFFVGNDQVWLCPDVPPQYLQVKA